MGNKLNTDCEGSGGLSGKEQRTKILLLKQGGTPQVRRD